MNIAAVECTGRRTFYFDTGVRPENCDGILSRGQVWREGVKKIPFDCDDVPEGSLFMFGTPYNDLPVASAYNVIVRETHNTSLCSKYAYFRIPKENQSD